MTANFTERDREFIRTLAKTIDAQGKRIAKLEKQVPPAEAVKSPIEVQVHTPNDTLHKRLSDGMFEVPDDMSSVNVAFRHPENVSAEQKAFILSLYKTLHDLCDEHDVAMLSVTIRTE